MARLATHDLGGAGPVLLMLHANGFHGRMFLPVARALHSSFRCIAIDLPGHGESAGVQLPADFGPEDIAACVASQIRTLGLKGCYCLGHSLGGSMALMVEAQHPGTFAGIYVYEPVVTTTTLRKNPADSAEGGPPLALMALKRRSQFASAHEAVASLGIKPPFSLFCTEALELYIEHGTRRNQDGMLELCCQPSVEASIYKAMDPLPTLDYSKIECPVTVALGRHLPGVHERLNASGAAVQAELRRGRLQRFETLSHLGPFEKPDDVAESVRTCLLSPVHKSAL